MSIEKPVWFVPLYVQKTSLREVVTAVPVTPMGVCRISVYDEAIVPREEYVDSETLVQLSGPSALIR